MSNTPRNSTLIRSTVFKLVRAACSTTCASRCISDTAFVIFASASAAPLATDSMPPTWRCPASIVAVTWETCWRTSLIVLVAVSAAWALESASWRTSSATTANPNPPSPARAASMAAFNAKRLV